MSTEAFDWMGRVKAVEREYRAIRFGTDRLIAATTVDPTILLTDRLAHADVHTASGQLEATYIIRLFAEFETALQHFLRAFNIRRRRAAQALVDRVRARGRVGQSETDAVHRVREYRNVLVHDRLARVAVVNLREATSALCTFLSHLKGIW
jgi:hypothetical protein